MRLILTTYVLVGGIVCRALLLRWTLVNQRKLAIEQARQRRAAAQNEGNSGEEAPAPPSCRPRPRPERDLATINTQTRRLVEYSLAVAVRIGRVVRVGRRAAGPGQPQPRGGLADHRHA